MYHSPFSNATTSDFTAAGARAVVALWNNSLRYSSRSHIHRCSSRSCIHRCSSRSYIHRMSNSLSRYKATVARNVSLNNSNLLFVTSVLSTILRTMSPHTWLARNTDGTLDRDALEKHTHYSRRFAQRSLAIFETRSVHAQEIDRFIRRTIAKYTLFYYNNYIIILCCNIKCFHTYAFRNRVSVNPYWKGEGDLVKRTLSEGSGECVSG